MNEPCRNPAGTIPLQEKVIVTYRIDFEWICEGYFGWAAPDDRLRLSLGISDEILFLTSRGSFIWPQITLVFLENIWLALGFSQTLAEKFLSLEIKSLDFFDDFFAIPVNLLGNQTHA